VQADALGDSGYFVLTQSAEGGVDTFVKKKKQSLFVHFQGHPEYGAETLLKEYREISRDFSGKNGRLIPQCRRVTSTRPANAW
jgi:homoserine O-succinyltransferase/O-acetyltransferase